MLLASTNNAKPLNCWEKVKLVCPLGRRNSETSDKMRYAEIKAVYETVLTLVTILGQQPKLLIIGKGTTTTMGWSSMYFKYSF